MVKATKEANVKGLGNIWYAAAPFDESIDAIKEKKSQIISASDLAYARMQEGKDHSLSTNGSYVQEGALFVPNGAHRIYLLRKSLVLNDPSAVTQAHRDGHEYFLGDTFAVVQFLERLPKGGYLALDDVSAVPTDRFGDDERMNWMFGKHAKKYGLFLKDASISATGFVMRGSDYVDGQSKPFVDQLWLHWLVNFSDIDSCGRLLDDADGVRGVGRESGEARPEKNTELYTPKQVAVLKKVLHDEGICGSLEKRILSGPKR